MNNICFDVQYFQANNLAGGGTVCVEADNTGKLIPAACSPGGTVTSVTGSGGLVCSPTSPNPTCTMDTFACSAGDFVSSASTGGLACTPASYQYVDDPSVGTQPQETHLGFGYNGSTLCTTDDPGNTRTDVEMCSHGAGAGSCTNCSITFDNYGRETTYTSGTAGADVLATYEVTSSSHIPVNGVNLGALASGVNEQTTSGGVATPLTFATSANRVELGATSGGGLQDSANLKFDGTNLIIGPGATGTPPEFNVIDNLGGFSQLVAYPSSGTNVGFSYDIAPRGTGFSPTNKAQLNVLNTDFIADPSNFSWAGFRAAGSQFIAGTGHVGSAAAFPLMFAADWFATGTTNANQLLLDTNGHVDLVSLAAGGVLKAVTETPTVGPSSGKLAIAVAGTDYQTPLTACADYVSLSCVSGGDLGGTNATPTVIGVENDAAMRGDLLATAILAPSTPTAGKARIYVDSGSKNLAVKDDAGNINHGIRTNTCGASHFFTAVGGDGSSTCAQPAFGDVTGSATCAQLPALTGDTHSSAGSCATVTTAITDGSATSWSTSGHTFVAGQPLIALAGNGLGTNAIKNFARTSSLQYAWGDLLLTAGGISCSLLTTYGDPALRQLCQPDGAFAEYGKGFAANFCRITVNVPVNTWGSGGVGQRDLTFQVSRNGTVVTGCKTPAVTAGFTGLKDSGEISVAGTAATDVWGVFGDGAFPNGGTGSVYVNLEIYQ